MTTVEEIKLVELWIKDLSKALGVDLQLNSDGICSFQIGEETIITIEASIDFPIINLYSTLLPFSADDSDHNVGLMVKALELNAFQALTRGGAIASAPGGGFLIFCLSVPIKNMDSEIFNRTLGHFFETAIQLKKMLVETDVHKPERLSKEPKIKA